VQLTNQFMVNVPVDDAWDILTAVERIPRCLPGADVSNKLVGQLVEQLEATVLSGQDPAPTPASA